MYENAQNLKVMDKVKQTTHLYHNLHHLLNKQILPELGVKLVLNSVQGKELAMRNMIK